ncbi:predicted protein [Phaeodactylum tricornutum CCAP 1055/1]|jgi:hypothetical protein|uniref:EF-hand domain-containing protein n=2 Tax=Phaeodactylum tricornutum TaxID=2850 RepID=B7FR19_PHATC|nr:predicted protein [Phaeodactylum tricornutum CCAP 1055/1]EEC51965.1 predicted protein [Phaeodactylum tricornutum CCAP 1055/1]|eukprot:XP_002177502.1 predicted protein [Phaeodactylum tricornutum CCAP 1055/1]
MSSSESTPLKGGGSSGPGASLDGAKALFQNFWSSDHVQTAGTFAQRQAHDLQRSVQEGHVSVRVLAQLAGIVLCASAFGGFVFSLLTLHLIHALLEVYTFALGGLMLLLESPSFAAGLRNDSTTATNTSATILRVLTARVHANARFLKFVWGRGLLYFVAGSLHFSEGGLMNSVIGGFVMIIGILYLVLGYQANRKLRAAAHAHPVDSLRQQFTTANERGNGTLNAEEFQTFVASIGMTNLGRHELEVVYAHVPTENTSGEISWDDFARWWNANAAEPASAASVLGGSFLSV